jgi:hypothetical protein
VRNDGEAAAMIDLIHLKSVFGMQVGFVCTRVYVRVCERMLDECRTLIQHTYTPPLTPLHTLAHSHTTAAQNAERVDRLSRAGPFTRT